MTGCIWKSIFWAVTALSIFFLFQCPLLWLTCAVCLVAQSRLTLVIPWTIACQVPLSMGILQANIFNSKNFSELIKWWFSSFLFIKVFRTSLYSLPPLPHLLIHFIYLNVWLCHEACGILVPWPGIEPGPWQGKHQVLTTGPSENSQVMSFLNLSFFTKKWEVSISCNVVLLLLLLLLSRFSRVWLCATP